MALSLLLLGLTPVLAAPFHLAPDYLNLEVYNPLNASVFTTGYEILSTGRDTVLIDAGFEASTAQVLVDKIKATHNNLSLVYISHSDPDYYFGLDVIQDAFPQAKIIATRATVQAINSTFLSKVATWNSTLGNQAPKRLVLPTPVDPRPSDGYLFTIGRDHDVYVLGPQPNRTFAYIPTIDTVLGGVTLTANQHVWMADTQTNASIALWEATLDLVGEINPTQVVPGHFDLNRNGSNPFTFNETVNFTSQYIRTFEQLAANSTNSTQLVNALVKQYPTLPRDSSLNTSAQVAKGELKWP